MPDYKYLLRKNHKEYFGDEEPLSLDEITEKFYFKVKCIDQKEFHSYLEYLNPSDILNVSVEKASQKKKGGRYEDGLNDPFFKGLRSRIEKEGVRVPIWAHEVPDFHIFWKRSRNFKYQDGKYNVMRGGHRTVVCELLGCKVPAFVLRVNEI